MTYPSTEVDDRCSDRGIPVRNVPFVKLSNYPGRTYTIVHIETTSPVQSMAFIDGSAVTLCGRRFRVGSYFWPQGWNHAPKFVQWTTCKVCDAIASDPRLMKAHGG